MAIRYTGILDDFDGDHCRANQRRMGIGDMNCSHRGWLTEMVRRKQLPDGYASDFLSYVAPLAHDIARRRKRLGRPLIVGISGAQGAGKSTLAAFIREWLMRENGLAGLILSLDDFYLAKEDRSRLAREIHPLLATRGVPGTHDVGFALSVMEKLIRPTSPPIPIPAFDKATDDRRPEDEWPVVESPADVVLFEGWCVGARPQGADRLIAPINSLEAEEDPDGSWRRYVNERLGGDYRDLFATLDALVMMRVPSFGKVREWRGLQEERLRSRSGGSADSRSHGVGQSPAELDRFVLHFERLTRHMLDTMPRYADAVLPLNNAHRIIGLECREGGFFANLD
jgi:D-glycerate 3-kinase